MEKLLAAHVVGLLFSCCSCCKSVGTKRKEGIYYILFNLAISGVIYMCYKFTLELKDSWIGTFKIILDILAGNI